MAVNMKRRFDGDDSSQEPERKRSAQAYDPLSQYPASGWCGELIRRAYRCLPCRKKKMRCDGNKPTCAHCAKLGTAYSPETFVLTGVCGRVGVWIQPEQEARLTAGIRRTTAEPNRYLDLDAWGLLQWNLRRCWNNRARHYRHA